MSKDYCSTLSVEALANEIVKKLEGRKAFRKILPFHLDRRKFLHLLRKDVVNLLVVYKKG